MEISLFAALASGPKKAQELQENLGISQPTLSRITSQARRAGRLSVLGNGRATRYALLRSNRGLAPEMPVHRISRSGAAQRVGSLLTLEPGGLWFAHHGLPGHGTEFQTLPWFLADLRPGGFVGSRLSAQWAELGLPPRPEDWTTGQALLAMVRRGDDAPGDLLIGDESLSRWLAQSPRPAMIAPEQRLTRYGDCVTELLAGRANVSWVAGEQPKFSAIVGSVAEPPRHVFVKFSGLRTSTGGRRWANLLLAEHLVTEILRENGHIAAVTSFLQNERRAFLEVQRFDRVGLRGRHGVVSLQALETSLVGERRGGTDSVAALLRAQRISSDDARELRWRAAFNALIGNETMKADDVCFMSSERGALRLGPAYDMLPTIYAPVGDDLPTREFTAPSPAPGYADQWLAALPAAVSFWKRLSEDTRATLEVRTVARENAARLRDGERLA